MSTPNPSSIHSRREIPGKDGGDKGIEQLPPDPKTRKPNEGVPTANEAPVTQNEVPLKQNETKK